MRVAFLMRRQLYMALALSVAAELLLYLVCCKIYPCTYTRERVYIPIVLSIVTGVDNSTGSLLPYSFIAVTLNR